MLKICLISTDRLKDFRQFKQRITTEIFRCIPPAAQGTLNKGVAKKVDAER